MTLPIPRLLPALAALAIATPAAAQLDVTLRVTEIEDHGPILTDADGEALYLFTADTQGGPDTEPAITCEGECLEKWPPFVMTQDPEAGEGVDAELIGTMPWQDVEVVTYGGWPLYYYALDAGEDNATGQDIESYGGEWYLVRPDGTKVGHED
ncbi:COG4315 family predicted lipoprotein [Jannaschia formosa]|uniref:COG4315 family predicted lipoprotein n=1 Tax=Jannaschia formosa TaxID=2259592 RepID=UPI0014310A03|nr:hypothetical protein [Jannaschia formosa]